MKFNAAFGCLSRLRSRVAPPRLASSHTRPTLDEVDPSLVALLRNAGDHYGPLGVARVASLLVRSQGFEP